MEYALEERKERRRKLLEEFKGMLDKGDAGGGRHFATPTK